MKDYDYSDDLSGLSEYLGAFGLGAPPVPMNLNVKPASKAPAKPVAKKAVPKVAPKPVAKKAVPVKAPVKKPVPAAKAVAKVPVKAAAKLAPKPAALKKTVVKPIKAPVKVAAKPTEPSKIGLIKTTVANVQGILNRLGAKIKEDGLFGATTKKAWGTAAKAKKLDGVFDRASSTEVWVHPLAFATLSAALPATKATKATAAAKKAATPSTKPTEPSKTGLTKINIGAAQDILNKLGGKIKRDGMFGPTTAKAWGTASKARKVDGVFDRAGPMEAWISPAALAALSAKAGVSAPAAASEEVAPPSAEPKDIAPPAPEMAPAAEDLAAQQLMKQATVAVPVLKVQQAELMANKTPAQAGRYTGVEETGEWDDATERGFYILFSIKAPYDGVWKIALQQLTDGSSIKLLPNQASEVQALSKLWLENKAKEEAKANEPAQPPEPAPEAAITDQPQANNQRVSEVVKRSTVIMPVKVLQQALRQLFDLQQEGKIPASPPIPLPQVTGSWRQGSDDVGLLLGWGDKLYPYGGIVPTEDKEEILSQIVFSSPTLNGLRGFGGLRYRNLQGLRGFGAVPDGNAIKLPPEIIANIQSLASDYVAKTQQSQPQSDSSQVLLPTGGGQVALEPELITGRVPTADQNMSVPSQSFVPAPMPYQEQIQAPAPISLTPNFPDVTNNSYFTPAPAPVAAPAVAPTMEPSTSTSLTVPVSTNLTIGPSLPSAPAPEPKEESSSMGLILGLLGVGAIAVLALKGQDQKSAYKPRKKAKR